MKKFIISSILTFVLAATCLAPIYIIHWPNVKNHPVTIHGQATITFFTNVDDVVVVAVITDNRGVEIANFVEIVPVKPGAQHNQ